MKAANAKRARPKARCTKRSANARQRQERACIDLHARTAKFDLFPAQKCSAFASPFAMRRKHQVEYFQFVARPKIEWQQNWRNETRLAAAGVLGDRGLRNWRAFAQRAR